MRLSAEGQLEDPPADLGRDDGRAGAVRRKVNRTSRLMMHDLAGEPTDEELAERMGMPVARIKQVLKLAREPISLETPAGDEEDAHLGDFI